MTTTGEFSKNAGTYAQTSVKGVRITELVSEDQWLKAYPVMKELRTTLDRDQFLDCLRNAKSESGYRLYAAEDTLTGEVRAVMGFRILTDFVHGRHLYIDDLVTSKDFRSQGLGADCLDAAELVARGLSCVGLRLCAGLENEAGRRFYEREGWVARAVAFKKKLI